MTDEDQITPDDEEQGGQPAPRRYGGGKYGSLEEFEKGYSQSFDEIQRVRGEAMAARGEAEAYRKVIEELRVNRQAPRDDGPEYIPVDPENGVSRAHVQSLASKAAADAARQAVTEALSPLLAGVSARTEMLQRNPEYGKHEVEIQAHLAGDPYRMQMYNQMAAVNPAAAMDYAFATWSATKPQAPAPDPGGKTQAGLPSGAPTKRSDEKAEMDQRKYNELIKQAQESGDYSEFLRFRLSGVVPPGHIKRPA